MLKGIPYEYPVIKTEKFTSIFDWEYTDSIVENYQFHPALKAEVAI